MERHYIHFETPELAKVITDTAPPPGPEEVLDRRGSCWHQPR